ncbi:hypothetical protein GF361_03215 [Candidatus Woesearchaeota archaeon]|nr:hypothetical protein [Candidatus Woesearchaeota archaeon]
MKWTASRLDRLKNITLSISIIVILLYLTLSLIESESKLVSIMILLPVIIFPYIAWKYEKQASIISFLIGSITMIWFAIDFIFLRIQRQYWHIPLFLLIAPLPAFIIGYIFWFIYKKRK